MYRVALFMAALKKMDNEQNFAIVAKNRFLLFAKMVICQNVTLWEFAIRKCSLQLTKRGGKKCVLTYNTTCPTFQLYQKIYLNIVKKG